MYGKSLPYNALKDFSAITMLWRFSVLAVPASSPAKDVAGLVEMAKTKGITLPRQAMARAGICSAKCSSRPVEPTRCCMSHTRGGACSD